MTLKVGATVRLKSGGPLMTVNKLQLRERVECRWFNDLS
ncbi:YodC family protein [Vibrio mediterranei]